MPKQSLQEKLIAAKLYLASRQLQRSRRRLALEQQATVAADATQYALLRDAILQNLKLLHEKRDKAVFAVTCLAGGTALIFPPPAAAAITLELSLVEYLQTIVYILGGGLLGLGLAILIVAWKLAQPGSDPYDDAETEKTLANLRNSPRAQALRKEL